jgi:hypothetical protein
VQKGLARNLSSVTRANRIMAAMLYTHDQVDLHGRDRAARAAFDRSATGVGDRLIVAAEHGPPIPSSIVASRTVRLDRAVRIAQAATGHGHAMPPARAASSAINLSVPDGHGGQASGTGTVLDPAAGQSGGGMDLTTRLDKTASRISGSLSQNVSMGGFAESCPDATGEVHGTGFAHSGFSIAVTQGDQPSVGGTVSIDGKATFMGRVNSHAQLVDYDMVYDGTYRYDGPAPGLLGISIGEAHQRSEVHMVFRNLRVGVDIDTDDLVRQTVDYQSSGFGVAGLVSGMLANAVSAQALFAGLIKHQEDDALTQAQNNWNKEASCLKASFDPGSLTDVDPGSTHPVSIGVTDVRPGDPPVEMPVQLSVSDADDGASVTPTRADTGASPIDATLTVSNKPGTTTAMGITGVSNRGRLSGTFHASVAGHLVLDYTYSSTANYTYPYNNSRGIFTDTGTFSEHRNIQLTTQIPLTAQGTTHRGPTGPNEQTYTGAAALTWQAQRWSWENIETTNTGQQYPTLCTSDDQENVAAAFPGCVRPVRLKGCVITCRLRSGHHRWRQRTRTSRWSLVTAWRAPGSALRALRAIVPDRP